MSNYKQYTGNLIFEGLTANSVVSFSGNSSILINGDLEVLGNTTLSGNITASTGNLDISGTAISITSGASETSISIVPDGPVSSQAFIDVPDNATANTDNVRIYNNLGNVEIATDSGNNVWLFDSSGFVYGPGRFRETATDNGLTLDGGADDVYLFTAGEGPVRIVANSDGETSREWTFSQDGSLTAPGDITVGGDVTGTSGANTLILKAQPTTDTYIQLNSIVDSTFSVAANLEIVTDSSNTEQTWTFDNTGNLTLPDGYTFGPSGSSLLIAAPDTTDGIYMDWASEISFFIGNAGGENIAQIGTLGGVWAFGNDGVLTAPGNITTTGNISGGNLITAGQVVATGNITGGNISAVGNITGNTAGYAIGYRDVPQISFSGDATIATTDAGKHYYSTLSTGNVLTIANNASQAFQVGAAITVVNQGTGNITVAQGSGVTLYLAGNATSGNRTVGTFGMATVMKVATDTWFISGAGVV